MAKRYTQYENLPLGNYKPGGTLGRHHCVVTDGGDHKVVAGYDGQKVVVRPGDTLGYDCGTVWKVPSPESYRDPVRRVLAEAKLPQRILSESAEPLVLRHGCWWKYISCPSVDTLHGEYVRASLGDVQTETENLGEQPLPEPRPSREPMVPGSEYRTHVAGGDVIIVETPYGEETSFLRRRRVTRVVIRPGVDRKVAADWLRKELKLDEKPNS